jgi:hypothetical protein
MNQKRAKLIRKTVYNHEDFRARRYRQLDNGQVVNSDVFRASYQEIKKEVKGKSLKEIASHLLHR